MRLTIYGTLCLIALILGTDTYIGNDLTSSETSDIRESIAVLKDCRLDSDVRMAQSILKANRFRRSRFFDWLNNLSEVRGYSFGFYAYTPLLSRHRVFIGRDYWQQDAVGRASVTIHELAHLRRHGQRSLRGFPRDEDECSAYRYQYRTYPIIGLGSSGEGSDVYWDMMYGILDYVIPEFPGYAKRKDVAEALMVIERTE